MSKSTNRPKVLITGGPTRAYLDDVRFLTNVSTGSLAFELGQALQRSGWDVVAVIGPSELPFESLNLFKLVRVETHDEMLDAVVSSCRKYRPPVGIFAAAVLDFAPQRVRQGKVSSRTAKWQLTLVPTKKIIDEVGRRFPKMRRYGFKLESGNKNVKEIAQLGADLIRTKGLEGLCLNFLPEVSANKHTAHLFRRGLSCPHVAHQKKQIAKWFVQQLGNSPDPD